MSQERCSRGRWLLRYAAAPGDRAALQSISRYGSDDDRGDVEDDVDAATPVDAQNAPTGVWKSRKQREIPTAPTSIIVTVQKEKNEKQDHLHQLSTESDHLQIRDPNG
jgi:hypothetical protein